VATGAACCVERDSGWEGGQDLAHDWLLEVDQFVARAVVVGRPTSVDLAGRHFVRLDRVAELVGCVEQTADLLESLVRECAVVLAFVRTQQREAFHAE
jgi:hypothetical protein